MSTERIFVGRIEELKQFDQVLRAPQGQVVLVIGQQGMGKTMLVNRMAKCAQDHPDLQCGTIRYEVTPHDSADVTMSLMMDNAFEAAQLVERSLEKTEHRHKQWVALVKLLPKGGELAELVSSLKHDPQRSTRDQFIQRLQLISDRLPSNGRAIFIIDPEKYMETGRADDWRLVMRDLPDKIIFVFAQRVDGVLVSNSDFLALTNLVRVPEERLSVLDEKAIDDLIQLRAPQLKVTPGELRTALARYNGHPYAIPAALDLLVDGLPIGELPDDPTPERVAEAQWRRVGEHGEDAVKLLEAYTVLEVPVPNDVVVPVSGVDRIKCNALLAKPFIAGLLRKEPDGRRIYHSLLTDHIRAQLSENSAAPYHHRAIDVYRKRLTANVRPDALAATRLPEHVLIVEGPEAFVICFVNECGLPLKNLGLLDTFIAFSHRALDIVDEGTVHKAMVAGNLGLIYKSRGDLDGAEAMHRKSLAIEEKLGRLEGMASDYGNLGIILETRGDLDGAEAMCRKALKINEKLNRLEGMASQYGNLGNILQARGDLDGAEDMYRKSLEIDEKLSRREGMASTYGNIGLILGIRGDLDGAEAMYRKSLEISEKLGLLEGMANQYGNLGIVFKKRGELDGAEAMYRKSLEINEKLNRLEGMASNYGNLGIILQTRGDLEGAEAMHRKALEINEKLNRLEGMASNYGNLGIILQTRGDLDRAVAMYRKALEINENLGRLEGMASNYGNLGSLFERCGDISKAREYWEKARDIFQQIGMPHMVEKAQGFLDDLPPETP